MYDGAFNGQPVGAAPRPRTVTVPVTASGVWGSPTCRHFPLIYLPHPRRRRHRCYRRRSASVAAAAVDDAGVFTTEVNSFGLRGVLVCE